MGGEIVHEDTHFLLTSGRSQLGKVLLELLHIHRVLEHLEMLEAPLLGDTTEQRQCRLLQLGQVNGHVLLLQGPLCIRYRLPGHHRFIDINEPVTLVLGLGHHPSHTRQLLPLPLRVRLLRLLIPSDLLLLDLVEPVDLSQQRWIHVS